MAMWTADGWLHSSPTQGFIQQVYLFISHPATHSFDLLDWPLGGWNVVCQNTSFPRNSQDVVLNQYAAAYPCAKTRVPPKCKTVLHVLSHPKNPLNFQDLGPSRKLKLNFFRISLYLGHGVFYRTAEARIQLGSRKKRSIRWQMKTNG